MIKEKYFAVRIGNPTEYKPYLMLREGEMNPALFCTRLAAAEAVLKRSLNRTDCKVVAVNVCETK